VSNHAKNRFVKIGPYQLSNNLILAPMTGITDLPFRTICKRFGAGLTISEMLDSNPQLRDVPNTYLRLRFSEQESPRCVQIVGQHPQDMADMAKFCVDNGANIIDINMGCPSKKICRKKAGAALLKDAKQAEKILSQVVQAVDVPVTVKIRSGWDAQHNNAIHIAHIAEQCGAQAITIHGRTRTNGYSVPAEYETARQIKQFVRIPVIVNGDIDTHTKLQNILAYTDADGAMIGRAALGHPWIFAKLLGMDPKIHLSKVMREHIAGLHALYGKKIGVLAARKHVVWYLADHPDAKLLCQQFHVLQAPSDQLHYVSSCL